MDLYKKFKEYYLYFMMYAVIGWCYEVFLEVVIYNWGFTNRGVLFGPYCPIYGVGAIIFLFVLNKLISIKEPSYFKFIKPFLIFLCCMIIATSIELIASYILEFSTGSWPWQTYSDYQVNFQSRIALSPSVRFGIGGVIFIYILQPIFVKIISKMNIKLLNTTFYIVFILFCIDIINKIT